jgi:type IV pilus assembly protein PilQ
MHLVNEKVSNILHFIANENNLRLVKNGSIYKLLPPKKEKPKPKKINVEVKDGKLSVDLRNDEINTVIRLIALQSGATILLDKNASGRLSGLIQNLPFEIGLESLLENNGFRLQKKQNIYFVERKYLNESGRDSNNKSQNFYLTIIDSTISLEVQDAPLNKIIQEAARRLNKNIFLYGKVEGKISARADSLKFLQLLNLLFQGSEYTYKIESGIILIGNKSVKGIATSELIKLNYLKADKVIEVLPEQVKRKVDINPIIEQNGIMVIGTRGIIDEIKNYVRTIDKPSPQILIETLVIDMNDSNIRDIGLDLGYGQQSKDSSGSGGGMRVNSLLPGIDVMFSGQEINNFLDRSGNLLGVSKIGQLPTDFYVKVKALESKGYLKVHSRPQIATLNGYEADISIGTTQYYKLVTKTPFRDPNQLYVSETEQFKTIEANISLKIIPWVSGSGEITVEIHPEFKTPIGSFTPDVPPTIQSRALNSTVRLKDGETIVLGGLVQNSIEKYDSGTPFLSDIPLIGNLFKSQGHNVSKTQLLIYVTPYLYYGDE